MRRECVVGSNRAGSVRPFLLLLFASSSGSCSEITNDVEMRDSLLERVTCRFLPLPAASVYPRSFNANLSCFCVVVNLFNLVSCVRKLYEHVFCCRQVHSFPVRYCTASGKVQSETFIT